MQSKFAVRYNNWNVYIDNAILLGTASVDIGEISHNTIEVSGSGIAGSVAIPARGQVPSFQITLHFHCVNRDVLSLLDAGKHTLELRMCADAWDKIQADAGEIYQSIFCVVYNTSVSIGSVSPNAEAGATSTHEVAYIRIDEDGATVYELDKFAQIEKVIKNGKLVDVLEKMRNNL